jgi:hypothetical protein
MIFSVSIHIQISSSSREVCRGSGIGTGYPTSSENSAIGNLTIMISIINATSSLPGYCRPIGTGHA